MALKLFAANSVGCRFIMPGEEKKRGEKKKVTPRLADFQLKKSMLGKNIAGSELLPQTPSGRIHNVSLSIRGS